MKIARSFLIPLTLLSTLILSGCGSKIDPATIQLSQSTTVTEAEAGKDGIITAKLSTSGDKSVKAFVGVQSQSGTGNWLTWSEPVEIELPATKDFSAPWVVGDTKYRVALWSSKPKNSETPIVTSAPVDITGWNYKAIYEVFTAARTKSNSGIDAFYTEKAKCFSLPNNRGNISTFRKCYSKYSASFKNNVKLNSDYTQFLVSYEVPPSLSSEFRAYREAASSYGNQFEWIYDVYCSNKPETYQDWQNCVGSTIGTKDSWTKYATLGDALTAARGKLASAFVDLGLPDFTTQ